MTYDYECSSCKAQWNQEQSIKDEPIKVCPMCKQDTAHRLISGTPWVHFKGWGWSGSGYDKTRTSQTGKRVDDHEHNDHHR